MVDSALPTFLKPAEVAKALKISTTAVYAMCDAGELACHRIGLGKKRPRIIIALTTVQDYLAKTEEGRDVIRMPKPEPKQRARVTSQSAGFARLRALGWKG